MPQWDRPLAAVNDTAAAVSSSWQLGGTLLSVLRYRGGVVQVLEHLNYFKGRVLERKSLHLLTFVVDQLTVQNERGL